MIFYTTVSSQNSETVTLKKYTQKNGLTSYNIRKIIQDKWGFMWIATQDGISKFDGKTFTNYTKTSLEKNRICGTDVRELIEDTSNNLIWVLPGEVGINAISSITGKVMMSVVIPNVSNDDWNISMLKNNDELWIGTSTGVKIYNIKTQKFVNNSLFLKRPKSLLDFAVRSIVKDENGNVWAAYDRYGLVIYDGQTHKIIQEIKLAKLNDHLKSNEIRFLSNIPLKGAIVYATNQGLRKISYSDHYQLKIDNYPCHGYPLLNTESIECIALDKQRNVFVSGFSKLFRFDTLLNKGIRLEQPGRIGETDWLDAVQCIYSDLENNIWIGCQEGAAFISNKINPFHYYCYDETSNITLDHVRSILPLKDGNILAGLRNGIISINNYSARYTKYDIGHLYHHIYYDSKGLIHVSRPDGMFIFNAGRLTPVSNIYPEFSSYSSVAINSHLLIDDTTIIVGSENNHGILIWNPKRKNIRTIEQGEGADSLASNIVNNLYRDSKHDIWILSDNVISILSKDLKKKKELKLIDKSLDLPYRLFFDMCEANGYYWITSYGSGILQLDSAYNIIRILSTADKLSNDGVYQIHNLLNNNLLITSNNGLSLLNINTYKIKTFFEADGLHSSGFEEVCGLKKGKLIYAGGLNGFTIINPSKFSINKMPPAFYFTKIEVDKTTNGLISKVDSTDLSIREYTIRNNWLQANISFVGLNYISPDRVTYQYRIKERDTSWVNIGTQNFINLIGLNPGKYTLEVKAANEDGYWSPARSLILIFQPKWYQTWWFNLSVILVAGGLLFAFYRYRISQIKQQQQIRKDVASDLHDDIGSSLNTVKIFAHLAKKEKEKESYLDEIESSLTNATSGLRDMLWVLDDSQDTTFELVERIKKFALPVLNAQQIQFNAQVDSDDHTLLSKTEKRNLYLISKESINNSIKYASCKNIRLHIYKDNHKTTLLIHDDGKGFDTTKLSEGNGLRNIRERARQIHYFATVISDSQKGTTIKLTKK